MEAKIVTEKKSRKFKEVSFYQPPKDKYYLLPFKFHRLPDKREILVNEIGDFMVVPEGTVERIVMHQLSSEEPLYEDLIASFFISPEPIPPLLELVAIRYRTKKSFLDAFTSLHIFVISLRCEHTCHYCQVSRVTSDKNKYDMSREHIDAGIEMMMRTPNPNVTMEFQGGEALLAFDNIVYAVDKAKEAALVYNKKVSYVICTNLAPLTDEMLVYCKENSILISTSLDGPVFVHDKNRHKPNASSYELAVNGINRCREVLGPENVSALTTTTRLSLEHPIPIVDEYVKLGCRNIFLRPISPYGFAVKTETKNKYETGRFLEYYKTALDRIIEHNLNGYYIREDYATIILRKLLTPFPVGYVDLQSPAGLINNVIVFNYDGAIYASDEARMLAEMKDDTFRLGKLGETSYNDVFYGEKTQAISEFMTNESLPGCSECAFQSYCGADPVLNHATQGDMAGFRPNNSFCQRNMEIIQHIIMLMEDDKKIERIFRSWITGKS
jgi:His-Xaa-Ser system radical SAM maturase HxsB